MNQVTRRKGISLLIFPFMVSMVITFYFVSAMLITKPWHATRMILFTIVLLFAWGGVFIYDQIKSKWFCYRTNIFLVIILSALLAFFLTFFIWGKYTNHNLMPFWLLDSGHSSMDTLFHSAIAEHYKHSWFPSALINETGFMRYHTFSHFIIGHIAGSLDIPSYLVYTLLYPVIFFPLYIFSQLFVIKCAKRYFDGKAEVHWQITDFLVIMLFNIGFAYEGNYDGREGFLLKYRVGRFGRIESESFLIANIITFVFIGFCFLYLCKDKTARKRTFFLLFVIPVCIFIITVAKISTGMMIVFVICWYIFRREKNDWKKFGILMLYVIEFVLTSILTSRNVTPGGPNSVTGNLTLFATNDQFIGKFGLWGHWFILSLMTGVFVYFDVRKHRYTLNDIIGGKTVWIEIIVLSSILLFLPGFLINIGGGSAGFFSCLVEYLALVLLCGQKWYEEDRAEIKRVLAVITLMWSLGMVFTNLKTDPLEDVTPYNQQEFSKELIDLYTMAKNNPQDYTIYLDEDARITQVGFYTDREQFYVYPAMTGISVINATYVDNGEAYSWRGNYCGNYYDMNNTKSDHPMSYEEAVDIAIRNGKKKIIHMTSNGYDITELGN